MDHPPSSCIHIDECVRDIWNSNYAGRTSSKMRRHFHGACVDTGAQQLVIGQRQAKAYCRRDNFKFKLHPSATRFRFGDGRYPSLGSMEIRIPIPNGSFVSIQLDVVSADVPMLLGLDVLDRESLVANNVHNELQAPLPGWSMPLEKKFGRLYLCWGAKEILYTKHELVKLHVHFCHLSTDKLYEVIKRARPSQVDESTRKLLEEITRSCEKCQTFSTLPQRFPVSLPPSNIVFNSNISMDLMWIDMKAALHVVDLETNFSSASFLPNQTLEGVWDAFV